MTDRADIFQLDRETVRVKPREGYEASVMIGTDVEVFISALDGSESYRVRLAKPNEGETIKVHRDASDKGGFDIVYKGI